MSELRTGRSITSGRLGHWFGSERFDVIRDIITGYFYAIEFMADRLRGREISDAQYAELHGGVLAGLVNDSKLLVRPDDRGLCPHRRSLPIGR